MNEITETIIVSTLRKFIFDETVLRLFFNSLSSYLDSTKDRIYEIGGLNGFIIQGNSGSG